jgi:tetratricopeptide (TPR) repeat protein
LSVSHGKVGDVLNSQGNLEGALDAYRASLAIVQRLTGQHGPDDAVLQADLSKYHRKVGDALSAQGNLEGARGAYRVSLAIIERLTGQGPDNADWQRALSVSCSKMADLLERQNQTAGAAHYWQRAYATLSAMKRAGLFIAPSDEGFLEQLRVKLGEPR